MSDEEYTDRGKEGMTDDDEFDLDDILHDESDAELFFNERCETIESILKEMDLALALNDEGVPYGRKGLYVLDEPIVITVDRKNPDLVRIVLYLFSRRWKGKDFDFEHFYETMAKRCFLSLRRTPDENIEYSLVVPEVSLETFPEVFRATIEGNLGFIGYFRDMYRHYSELFC